MKIRQGFVSNSSSSSFVIVSKNGELNKEKIKKAFEGAKNTPFESLINTCADTLYNESRQQDVESVLDDYGFKTFDDFYNDVIRYKETRVLADALLNNEVVYTGKISDQDGDSGSYTVCGMKIDYEDDDIIIYKEAWY
jgi:N-methylhydantoinase B/oxoprolinase/acetone carboxylase alpha subunit